MAVILVGNILYFRKNRCIKKIKGADRPISLIRPKAAYLRPASIRSMRVKFHEDGSETERLVCMERDRKINGLG